MSIESREPEREYTVGVSLEGNRFFAEIEPPLQPEANLEELSKVAFSGTGIDISLLSSVASYLPYSTVFAGQYRPHDKAAPYDELQRSIRVGMMKMLSPAFSVDVNVEFLDAE